MRPKEDIKKRIKNAGIVIDTETDKKIFGNILQAFDKSKASKSDPTQTNLRRIIMRSRITKLAVAAAIIIAVILLLHINGGPGMTTVAWAEVARKVEQAQTFFCRIRTDLTESETEQSHQGEALVYSSSDYGTRTEMYMKGKLVSINYLVFSEGVYIGVMPKEKRYIRMVLPPDKAKQMRQKEDPREMVMQLMSIDYHELEPTQIDGVDVEGIEAKNSRILGGMFEDATARLWVARGTDWPVRLEIEGIVAGGSVRMKMVMDDFQWGVHLEPSLFDPNIPSDYTAKEMNLPEVNEEKAIQGLRTFAELADGCYPNNLAMLTVMKEIGEALKSEYGKQWKQDTGQEKADVLRSILKASSFYAKLQRESKDIAYYGDKVTVADVDAVLLRWKISDEQYRVIYSDLTTENISAKQLAELEATLPQ